jgi:hypothetical protein
MFNKSDGNYRKVYDSRPLVKRYAERLLLYIHENSTKQSLPSAHGVLVNVRVKISISISGTCS